MPFPAGGGGGGAGGNVGSSAAAKAPADGHTLLYGTNRTLANNRTIYKAPGFSPTKDFDPVTQLTSIAALVVARPGLPVN